MSPACLRRIVLWTLSAWSVLWSGQVGGADPDGYFEIRVIDRETSRGIPLVELVRVDDVRFVTDNAGRIAYSEPGHAGRTIFFAISAPGYRVPRDGFGIAGVRLTIEPGGQAEVPLERINLAERLYRCTGEGLYRDSVLLEHETPIEFPLGAGQVAGQDSVQVAEYRGQLYWFWGDTNRLLYPLGLFRTAGATSDLPRAGGLPPSVGINYRYFVGRDGFVRAMVDVPDPQGVVWIDGVCTVEDSVGETRMLCRFSRRPGLAEAYEQGLMIYNDERELFEVAITLPVEEQWRLLHGHPIRVRSEDRDDLLCGNPYLVTRVPAELESILDPGQYISWSCVDPATGRPRRNAQGGLDWTWQPSPPVVPADEQRWIRDGLIQPEEAYYLPVDVERPGRHVVLHSGTVHWNAYRQRWVMLAVEHTFDRESPSMLGEVWYTEAEFPQGPFRRAVKVLTHDRQTFYNPCQHPFFDEDGGRLIYFEGTYCNTFTQSPATQRYNYNQIMYRLDLGQPGIREAFPE